MMDNGIGPPCEACGKPVRRGQFVIAYEDVGEVHVDCDHPDRPPKTSTVDCGDGPMQVYRLAGDPMVRQRHEALAV